MYNTQLDHCLISMLNIFPAYVFKQSNAMGTEHFVVHVFNTNVHKTMIIYRDEKKKHKQKKLFIYLVFVEFPSNKIMFFGLKSFQFSMAILCFI